MSEHSEAWLLHAGAAGTPGELVLATIPLPELSGDRLLVEPLFGCWGGNMTHALQRSPLDICRQRGEVVGVAAASQLLFGKHASGLDTQEAAVLAARGRTELKNVTGVPRTVETVKQVPDALKGNEDPR